MVRHFGFIGHASIYMSNAWRLLQTVGWEHAEPLLCAAVGYMVMDGSASRQRENSDITSYAANSKRIKKSIDRMPADWAKSRSNPELNDELLELIRARKSDEACDVAVANLVEGKATAGAVWDAVLLGAGDCVVCDRGGNRPLHAITAANALRYAFEMSGRRENRLLILLQGLNRMERYQMFDSRTITDLIPAEIPTTSEAAAEELLGRVRPSRHEAASKAFCFAQSFPDSDLLFRSAARLLPAKAGQDVHSVKFPMAMFENCRWVSPERRPHMMAAASYTFLGTDAPDSQVIQQVRQAVNG